MKNSTFATVPSGSEALATMPTAAGAVNAAPAAGCVMLTLGALLPPASVTILATEGTPSASTTNSM